MILFKKFPFNLRAPIPLQMLSTNSFQESEELIRTLYVQNNYSQLLQLRQEFPALCNQDAEKAALFLPLLVKAQVESTDSQHHHHQDLHNNAQLFQLYLFILERVQVQFIPISLMLDLFRSCFPPSKHTQFWMSICLVA